MQEAPGSRMLEAMAYCILRVAKIKSRASLARAMQHNTRERQPDNADPKRTPKNHIERSTQAAMARYTERLPEKVRKNAVHAVEVMIAVPPEIAQAAKTEKDWYKLYDYLTYGMEWMTERLGGEANRLNWTLHVDEKSPHVHLIMMPLRDGKLNYRSYLGGSRDALVKLQTDYAKEVGTHFGLERGRPRAETGRRHITIGRFYAIGQDAILKEMERQRQSALQAKARREAKDNEKTR